MIYCPKCNTANRDNSKFCNECGADLAGATVRCQMCGDMNPPDRVNCANCGARLRMQVEAEPEEAPEEDAPIMPTDSAPASLNLTPPAPTINPAPTSDAQQEQMASSVTPNAADEMPDWLRELRTSPSSGPSPSTEPPVSPSAKPVAPEESPAWTKESLRSSADQTQTTEPTADEELPAWLRELRTGSSSEERTPSKPFKTPLMPSRYTPVSKEPSATHKPPRIEQPPSQPPAGALPDWLTQLRQPPAPQVPAAESGEAVELPKAELPDWLADLREAAPPSDEQASRTMPLTELNEPAKLSETPSAELARSEAPDWLKSLAPSQATEQPADWSMNDVAVEDLPAWLRPSAAPTPATARPQPTAAPSAGMPSAEGLAPGEIPPWLQALRPGGLETLSGEIIETSGLLAGIRGALPVESVLTLPHKSQARESAPATVPVAGFAELFAPQPPPPQEFPRQVRSTGIKVSWRALLIILIFVVAMLPFLPFFADFRGANITIHPESSEFYQTVNALNPNQLVLVAIDYSGGSRAELDPQAHAALLHLLQNKQHIITISFVSQGSQLAQDLLNGLNPANTAFAYPYNYGDTHVNLGYKSDGDAALRNLIQNPALVFDKDYRGQPLSSFTIAKDLKSINDFALLIVFSDEGTQVKRWVEQVAQPSGKLMLSGVSAAAAPVVMPYYKKQINGLLIGASGAAEYEVLLARPGAAAATHDAISYVAIVFVVVIVIGIVLALLFRWRRTTAA